MNNVIPEIIQQYNLLITIPLFWTFKEEKVNKTFPGKVKTFPGKVNKTFPAFLIIYTISEIIHLVCKL